jgi:transketolase N-terminal domain/subunit
MGSSSAVLKGLRTTRPQPIPRADYLLRQGVLKLLAVKDSDIRILTLEQCRDAVDKGLHAGGAFSATIPLVALYYGGFLDLDVSDPTRRGQDLFTLSKGHAVAAMAAIYADLGYFGTEILRNSRSYSSILNGHPDPSCRASIATGPMGQGFGRSGFAIAGRISPRADSYCMSGDGDCRKDPFGKPSCSPVRRLVTCASADRNNGQLDIYSKTVFPMLTLRRSSAFAGRRWTWTYSIRRCTPRSMSFDGPRNGKPTAIICNTTKGWAALRFL